MWLRAEGFEQVHAFAAGDRAGASLLASAGFTAAAGQDADRAAAAPSCCCSKVPVK